MLTDTQLQTIVDNRKLGNTLGDAVAVAGAELTPALLVWLRDNHYQLLTDAKFGEGHTEAEAALRKANS